VRCENVGDAPLLQSYARYLEGSCDHVSMDEFEPLNSKFNFPFGERSLVKLGPQQCILVVGCTFSSVDEKVGEVLSCLEGNCLVKIALVRMIEVKEKLHQEGLLAKSYLKWGEYRPSFVSPTIRLILRRNFRK
jgi:hypothetical protein